MDDNTIERLENWGRWVRDRTKINTCGSAEKNWRSPQAWGDWQEGTPGAIQAPIDALDADRCRRVISHIAGPMAWALHYRFVAPHANRWDAARKCRVYRPERLVILQGKALAAFRDVARQETRLNIVAHVEYDDAISI